MKRSSLQLLNKKLQKKYKKHKGEIMNPELIGYLRSSQEDRSKLIIVIDKELIQAAPTFTGKDDKKYIRLVVDRDRTENICKYQQGTTCISLDKILNFN